MVGSFTLEQAKKGRESQKLNKTGLHDPIARAKQIANTIKTNRANGYKGVETNRVNGGAVFNPKVRAMGLAFQKEHGLAAWDPEVRARAHAGHQRAKRIRWYIYDHAGDFHTIPFEEVAKRMREILNGDIIVS